MFSRIVPANSTGRCPIHAVIRDSALGVMLTRSAPLMVIRPASGRMNPSSSSITVDFPAPEGPTSTAVSLAGTRKLSPSSAGPRAGSQVKDTPSKATVTPEAATVRIAGASPGVHHRRVRQAAPSRFAALEAWMRS